MVRLAISGNPHFVVDDREIRRGSISYTVDTVAEIRAESPTDEFFLLIGNDSLASMDRWHKPTALLSMIDLAVIQRGGESAIDFAVLTPLTTPDVIVRIRENVIAMPIIEISSSDLRTRCVLRDEVSGITFPPPSNP